MELVVGRVLVTLQVLLCTLRTSPQSWGSQLVLPLANICAKDIICGSSRLEHRDRATHYQWWNNKKCGAAIDAMTGLTWSPALVIE